MVEPARAVEQRKLDTLKRLIEDKDLWIATGDRDGNPTLVPLSFFWDGNRILVATVLTNPTARNIVQTGRARVALGHTRDVVLIDTTATLLDTADVPEDRAESYAAKCGWDPRKARGYRFFDLEPKRIEVWREDNEHPDRLLMQDGEWLCEDSLLSIVDH